VAEPRAIESARFPTAVGILLSLAAALHVLAVSSSLLGKPVAGGTWFLTGQFLVTLSLLRLYNGKWVIQDIRMLFAIFLFLYGGALPLVIVSGNAGAVPGVAGAAFMYGTAFLGFNLVQWWYRQPFHDVPQDVFNRIRPTYVNLAIMIAAFMIVIAYAVSAAYRFSRSSTEA